MLALADLGGIELTREIAESALADLLPKNRALDPDAIIAAVARSFGLERERLLGRERAHEVALPRQIAMYLIREETGASLPQVGEALGGRDHTTVMYGCEKIGELLEQDDSLRRQVLAIRQTLYNQGAFLPA